MKTALRYIKILTILVLAALLAMDCNYKKPDDPEENPYAGGYPRFVMANPMKGAASRVFPGSVREWDPTIRTISSIAGA